VSNEEVEKGGQKFQHRLGQFYGTNFPKILWCIVNPVSPLTFDKIWLALVYWPLCGKPGNDGKS